MKDTTYKMYHSLRSDDKGKGDLNFFKFVVHVHTQTPTSVIHIQKKVKETQKLCDICTRKYLYRQLIDLYSDQVYI